MTMEPSGSGDLYTCDTCKGEFRTDWPEARAEAEYQGHFGGLRKEIREKRVTVCDDCYRRFMKWMRKQPLPQ